MLFRVVLVFWIFSGKVSFLFWVLVMGVRLVVGMYCVCKCEWMMVCWM